MKAPKSPSLLLTLVDYERIFRVIYTVLHGRAKHTHRSCIFFAMAGAAILREHHRLDAKAVSGAAAYLVDEERRNVATFAAIEHGQFVATAERFHCWVECEGWVVDFMAPLFDESLSEYGMEWSIPRRMFQRRASESGLEPRDLAQGASFVMREFAERTRAMHAAFDTQAASGDLCRICTYWYRRAPKRMESQLDIGDDAGAVIRLELHGPAIVGVW